MLFVVGIALVVVVVVAIVAAVAISHQGNDDK